MIKNKITTQCLNALKIAATKFGLDGYYKICEYLEEGICLYKNNNLWHVYCTEKGNKYGEKKYENCCEACIRIIEIISDSNQILKKLLIIFEQELLKQIFNYNSYKKNKEYVKK